MTTLMPFGKLKGWPLDCLSLDPEYASWLFGQDWLEDEWPAVHAYLKSAGTQPKLRCQETTVKGEQCQRSAKDGPYCGQHAEMAGQRAGAETIPQVDHAFR